LEEQPNKPNSNKVLKESLFLVFPNPANSHIYIQKQNLRQENFTLTNALGRVVQTFSCKDYKNELFIGELNPGFYFLTNGVQSQALIITH
jgi:hypothetical protein